MGKCLSCCLLDDEPTHNGHAGPSPPAKAGGGPIMMSPRVIISTSQPYAHQQPPYQHHPPHPPPPRLATTDILVTKPQTNGERKMFSPYSKLPPIRKTSDGSNKRTSLPKDVSELKITQVFEKYKDPDEDAILADGIENLCNDLEVKPEEFRVLVLAWKLGAETMCRFTRAEFVSGCRHLAVDSVKGMQSKFPDMLAEVTNKQVFKEFYRWTYKFGLDSDIGQRTLPVDMALSLWQLVFSLHEPSILKRWLIFLEMHPNIRGIPKDTWDMFLNFSETVGDDLSNYDDTEAWPSLFDDFVEYENDRQNQNLSPEKDRSISG